MDEQATVPVSGAPAPRPETKWTLPFSRWLPILVGVGGGLALRLVFSGDPGGPYAAMMASFIYLAPFFVGAVTVYFAERVRRRTWSYYARAAFLANVLFVCGSLLIMIEGLICAILIVPLFGLFGAFGGLVMGAVCRFTNWPRHAVYSFAALPLLFGFFETDARLPQPAETVERTVFIEAPPELVWRNIHNTDRIEPGEAKRAWIYRIGAPLPQTGLTRQTAAGPVRTVTMRKNVHFTQEFIEWRENRHARWKYHFDADSFPAGALDEHVMIGGHYFDMQEGAFTLTPQPGGTMLKMSIQYRVSTQFNWYARPLGRALLGNLEETVLEFYRHSATAPNAAEPRA